ncbi:MAG: hypothetical protein AB7K24_28270, partial [Gemmataceae bacterium]
MNHISLDAMDESVRQFVLSLGSDPQATILELNGQAIVCVVPARAGDTEEPWTEAKNTRRCQLIDREIDGELTPQEAAELHQLQTEAARHRRRVAPLPLEDA